MLWCLMSDNGVVLSGQSSFGTQFIRMTKGDGLQWKTAVALP